MLNLEVRGERVLLVFSPPSHFIIRYSAFIIHHFPLFERQIGRNLPWVSDIT